MSAPLRKPDWLKVRLPAGEGCGEVGERLKKGGLHTVCQSARCPNLGECWSRRTATFMILGDVCTRHCGFCAVAKGAAAHPDPGEPGRVACTAQELGIRHVVITSVTRDDLADGGAAHWAATVRAVRAAMPRATIEALIPDFQGSAGSLAAVLESGPDVLNHNVETVPELYARVRPQADYRRSVELLALAKRRGFLTKTGLMLGLGEEEGQVARALGDLRGAGVDILTLGQYLQPSAERLPVARYVSPEEFDGWKRRALALGFKAVESAPLVRSSYKAGETVQRLLASAGEARDAGGATA